MNEIKINLEISEPRYSQKIINKVWNKCETIPDLPPELIRKDMCGAIIIKTQFNNENSKYGWCIDLSKPKYKGGKKKLDNMQVLQWENHLSKEDNYPYFKGVVSSSNLKNINKETHNIIEDEEYRFD